MIMTQTKNKSALFGALLILPTLLFVLIGSSKVWAPGNPFYGALDAFSLQREAWAIFNVVSPVIFLGGLFLALLLNLRPMLKLNLGREQKDLVATLRVQPSAFNLGLIVLSLALLAVLVTYAILENWQCLIGQKVTC